jgi:hypothetical protein
MGKRIMMIIVAGVVGTDEVIRGAILPTEI